MRRRRDPFARITYVPERCVYRVPCDWCGQHPAPRRPSYRVRIEHDGGRTDYLKGQFDSWSCAESYHDGRIGR